MALLEGHVNTVEATWKIPWEEGQVVRNSTDQAFAGQIYDFDALHWTHPATISLLQGTKVLDLLGPTVVLLRGLHRERWWPRPGMRDVRLLVPLHNPQKLGHERLFKLAIENGF
jgi:hypothetical protein